MCSKQPRLVNYRPSTSFVDNAIDLPWRNFLSPEFGTKFQREVPSFLEILKFPYNTVRDSWKEASMPKQLDSSARFDTMLACDRRTDEQTDRWTHDDSQYIASMASRGKNRGTHAISLSALFADVERCSISVRSGLTEI